MQIDQIKTWNLPIILVAKSGLGTLNHTLLSIESLHKRGISIIGLILNGPLHQDNPKTLLDFSGVPIIAQLPQFKTVSSKQLSEEWVKQNGGYEYTPGDEPSTRISRTFNVEKIFKENQKRNY